MSQRYSEYADDHKKRERVTYLMGHLWRQTPRHDSVSTCNNCTTPECGYRVIGTGTCKRCTLNELQALIGVEDGSRYGHCIEHIRDIEKRHLSEPDDES